MNAWQDLHGASESVAIKDRFDVLMTTFGFHPSAAGLPPFPPAPLTPGVHYAWCQAYVGAEASRGRRRAGMIWAGSEPMREGLVNGMSEVRPRHGTAAAALTSHLS